MGAVRHHLRAGVAAWLVCHALTFTALLPRDCCAAHGHAAAAAAADDCPLHHAAAPQADGCRLTGACDAPAAALSAVLLQSATPLPAVTVAPAAWTAPPRFLPPAPRPLALALPPDAPPPRA